MYIGIGLKYGSESHDSAVVPVGVRHLSYTTGSGSSVRNVMG